MDKSVTLADAKAHLFALITEAEAGTARYFNVHAVRTPVRTTCRGTCMRRGSGQAGP
jgi:hypothetical protein